MRRAIEPPGEARADWRIAADFALKLGPRIGRPAARLFSYADAEAIFAEHAESTRGRDLDISALSYAILDREGPQQWPYREGKGVPRLYSNGRFETQNARARFVPIGAPVWVPETRRHCMTVGVEVFNNEVARMLIERAGEEIEVAVGLPDALLAGLGRRQRSAVQGLTTHALAELIVGCAWPAITHFREAVGSS